MKEVIWDCLRFFPGNLDQLPDLFPGTPTNTDVSESENILFCWVFGY